MYSQFRKLVLSTALSISTVTLCGSSAAAAPLVIDRFLGNQSALSMTYPAPMPSISSMLSDGSILGGERDLEVQIDSGVIVGNGLLASVVGGALAYSQDATIAGSLSCQWDGPDSRGTLNAAGLSGIDVTGSAMRNSLLFQVAYSDLPVDTRWTIYTDDGHASSATWRLPGLITSDTPVAIPLRAFAPVLGGGADFGRVGAITLRTGSSVSAPSLAINLVQIGALVQAHMTATLLDDVASDGVFSVGDTLRYVAVIKNGADAFRAAEDNLEFTLAAPPFMTLVGGSVRTSQGAVISGHGVQDRDVHVYLGSLADGLDATVTFDMRIDSLTADSVQSIPLQGLVTSDSLALPTDDPATLLADDATSVAINTRSILHATMRDVLEVDADSDGKFGPGDTLQYVAEISNGGPLAKGGLSFAALLDPATVLVPGSVQTSSGSILPGDGDAGLAVRVLLDPVAGSGGTATVRFSVRLAARSEPISAIRVHGSVRSVDGLLISTDDPDSGAIGDATVTEVAWLPETGMIDALGPRGGLAVADGERGGFSCSIGRGSPPAVPVGGSLILALLGLLHRRNPRRRSYV